MRTSPASSRSTKVVLRQESDLRRRSNCSRYELSYNEALDMRLAESADLASMRLWFASPNPLRAGRRWSRRRWALSESGCAGSGSRGRSASPTASRRHSPPTARSSGHACSSVTSSRCRPPCATQVIESEWRKCRVRRSRRLRSRRRALDVLDIGLGLARLDLLAWHVSRSAFAPMSDTPTTTIPGCRRRGRQQAR